ncbi:MAG TPA: hypothetical protein VH684_09475 [Xanthobacteraceae bacterium]|jgi:hypothetical protein
MAATICRPAFKKASTHQARRFPAKAKMRQSQRLVAFNPQFLSFRLQAENVSDDILPLVWAEIGALILRWREGFDKDQLYCL